MPRRIISKIPEALLLVVALAPSSATASGLRFRDFKFEFFGVAALGAVIGAFCIWLGYKLFNKGVEKGKGQLDFQSKFFSLVFSGVGPGLFFMAFGAIIVLIAVVATTIGSLS